jgi:hypothetical protein
MRTYRLIVALLIASFAAGVTSTWAFTGRTLGTPHPTAPAPGPTTYQLLCRGGGGMNLIRGGPVPDANGVEMVVISLTFVRSSRPAGPRGRGLRAGQCGWIDRPVNSQEPTELRFKTPLHAAGNPGSDVNSSDAERFPDAFSIPNYMTQPNHLYTFSAYTATDGFLRATDSRYFKP